MAKTYSSQSYNNAIKNCHACNLLQFVVNIILSVVILFFLGELYDFIYGYTSAYGFIYGFWALYIPA